ncbi:MAG: hypothetical protein MK291_08755 [Planctomycetes bacterium]|nr:hypothetical protein [Planctomycetota bacterium]
MTSQAEGALKRSLSASEVHRVGDSARLAQAATPVHSDSNLNPRHNPIRTLRWARSGDAREAITADVPDDLRLVSRRGGNHLVGKLHQLL